MTIAPGRIMLDEIHEQAALARRWADGGGYDVASIAERVRQFDPDMVMTVGRGTSDNAASYGRYLLEVLGGFVVGSASPSTVSLYGTQPQSARILAVALSQSGQSPDVVAYLEAVRDQGGLTIAITNSPTSPLAAACDETIDLAAGPERAVAATKSFITQLLALSDLTHALSDAPSPDRHAVARSIEQALNRSAELEPVIDRIESSLRRSGFLVVAGRGLDFPIAEEAALKIMEVTRMPALGYSTADLAHGPVTILREGTPVIVVQSEGPTAESSETAARALAARGVEVFRVGSSAESGSSDSHFRLPSVDWRTDPIAAMVPLQLMAHGLALRLDANPDLPVGLTKITRTV